MMAVVESKCPEKKELFLNVSLSARTVTRRVEEMSKNLKSSQEDYFEKLQFFLIAIDESTRHDRYSSAGSICAWNKRKWCLRIIGRTFKKTTQKLK